MQLVFRLLSFSSINTPVTYRYAFRLTAPDCPVLLFSIYTVTGVCKAQVDLTHLPTAILIIFKEYKKEIVQHAV